MTSGYRPALKNRPAPADLCGDWSPIEHPTAVGACAASRAVAPLIRGVDLTLAVQLAEEALGDQACQANALCVWRAMTTLLCAGELVAADAHWLRLTASGPSGIADVLSLVRVRMARLCGDLDGAQDLLRVLTRESAPPAVHRVALPWLIELLAEIGEVERADALLADRSLNDLFGPVETTSPLVLVARGAAHLAAGRNQAALSAYLKCGLALTAKGVDNPSLLRWQSMAALGAKAAGQPGLARALAGEEQAAALRWGSSRSVGWALYTVAVVEGGDRGTELLREAVDLLELAVARPELGRATCDLGLALAASGETAAARDRLNQAWDLSRRMGDTRRGKQIEVALRQLTRPGAERSLSRQEANVAKLACAGYSNKQIAAKLFLTLRTVESHLTGTYRKLGISGRSELKATHVTFC
jgi:DNA-binding CsgD family transcriptional regulator